jgi:hypothetical protein
MHREVAVGLVKRIKVGVEEDSASQACSLALAFAFADGTGAVVGGVVATAWSAAWGEVFTALAGRAFGFGSGAWAGVGGIWFSKISASVCPFLIYLFFSMGQALACCGPGCDQNVPSE